MKRPQGWRSALSRWVRVVVVVVCLSAGFVLPAGASARSNVDLLTAAGVRIDAAAADDRAGVSVAGAGDVNGDGVDDVIVGADQADNNSRTDSGSAYVIYGTTGASPTGVDLASLGARGFRIDGAGPIDRAGVSVAGAGDVNGDGVDDVIVGANLAGNNSRNFSGSAYVIYGSHTADLADVDLASLGARGFRIDGAGAIDQAGGSVAGAGDVNGDGVDDVIVGANGADNNGRADSGSAYVVYGAHTADPADVDLLSLGARGFRVDGAVAGDVAGGSVAGAGDVNGDGTDDVIVGATGADNNGRTDSGSVYVIYGSHTADPADVDLASLGAGGFRIDGAGANDVAGGSVAGAGDVNGDGIDDVIVGADQADNNSRTNSGSAYVVYGGASPTGVDLASLGARGFRIDGAGAIDQAGGSVAGAGDVNDDGVDDVIVGAYLADNNGRTDSGSAYVIYGSHTADPSDVDLLTLGTRGFRVDGAVAGDESGRSVAGAGDVNGGGVDDVIVGAIAAGNNGRSASGSAYLLPSNAAPVAHDDKAAVDQDATLMQNTPGVLANDTDADDDALSATPVTQPSHGQLTFSADGSYTYIPDAHYHGHDSFTYKVSDGHTDSNTATVSITVRLVGPARPNVDLLTAAGVRIDGAAANNFAGWSVARAGDVNGDGTDDVIVGAYPAGNNGRSGSGSAYVIYGTTGASPTGVDLASLGARGFRIDGAVASDQAGVSVAGAGDVNGDGVDDVIVGATGADNNSRVNSGSAYVIYGTNTADPADVDLLSLGARGFRIDGAAQTNQAGGSVAGAGDVNGDGVDDVIVGASLAGNNGRGSSGSAYVIYGAHTADPADVDLLSLGARGFRVDGAVASDQAGYSVAGAGDVNGDGVDDVIVGAPGAGNNGRSGSGSAYVIYGAHTADPADVDLLGLGARGFRVDGAVASDQAGRSVAGAGDVNGDGVDDVIVGAALADNNSRNGSGSAYVIYGTNTADLADVDLASLGARGFRIDGAAASNQAGGSVAGAGDVNGDGIDDVIVGANQAGNNSRTTSGSAYVVYGGATPAGVDLASLGARGFRIDGAAAGDTAGVSVAGAGDVNGDGTDDVIVGAYLADNNSRTNSGSAYLVAGGVGGIGAADTATVAEDSGATTLDVLANDTGGPRTITGVGTPAHGSAAITHAGADLTYTPAADYCGSDSFTYTLDSGSQATVTVTVTCVNDAPVAHNDKAAVDPDATLTKNAPGVLSNDTDADGDALSATPVTQPSHGQLTFSADGSYTYIPNAHYQGHDSFTYKVSDGHSDSNTATVSITVRLVGPAQSNVDLLTAAGVRIDGAAASNQAGLSVAGAGDVNGDGVDDVIVGANVAGNNGRTSSGSAYVIYGTTGASPTGVDLASLGARGFQIDGAVAGDQAGVSVAGAGDVNSDGVDDVIVGALGAHNNSRSLSGSAYVIYGSRTADPADVDLLGLGARGFRIDGAVAGDTAGQSVAGAGDVNGDGVDDVIVGANGADNNSRASSGSAYVVYGAHTADPADLDLLTLGTRGFRIDGAAASDTAGVSVAGAGDVNGDGTDDVIVGANGADNNSRSSSGSAYVIYGAHTADPADVDLLGLGVRGFRIDGADVSDTAGVSVAGAGDVNGDGVDDVIVGANGADNNSRAGSGSAYVIYGTNTADPADVDLASLGARGFRIDGAAAGNAAGGSVAGAGDVNGDGVADVIVGANGAGNNGRPASGSAYVVYGGASPAGVDLASLGMRGFRIDGAAGSDQAGVSVAGSGDVNGDGFDDVIVGAYLADNNSRTNSGSAYLVAGGVGAIAAADTATVAEDSGATTLDVLANDTGDSKKITAVGTPAHGSAAITHSGADLAYTPAVNFCGSDSFTYTLDSGSQATVTVTVTCVNDAPVARDDKAAVDSDATLTKNAPGVLSNDIDVEGDALSATPVTQPSHGQLTFSADGVVHLRS